ncbi:MAG TPA: hypothetical protein PLO78_04320 [Candidatus Omnitrophota bacterium]|nr:hypothetical protein [Candidatus Omnitrophota bacterium]
MKKATTFLLLLAMLVLPAVGFAASPWTEEATYGDKVSGKLQFGLTNTLLGWTDLFFEPIRASKKCESCDSLWTGLGKGLTDAIVNEVGGAIHLLTFPLVLDLPLPDNGVQFATCCGCGSTAKK